MGWEAEGQLSIEVLRKWTWMNIGVRPSTSVIKCSAWNLSHQHLSFTILGAYRF